MPSGAHLAGCYIAGSGSPLCFLVVNVTWTVVAVLLYKFPNAFSMLGSEIHWQPMVNLSLPGYLGIVRAGERGGGDSVITTVTHLIPNSMCKPSFGVRLPHLTVTTASLNGATFCAHHQLLGRVLTIVMHIVVWGGGMSYLMRLKPSRIATHSAPVLSSVSRQVSVLTFSLTHHVSRRHAVPKESQPEQFLKQHKASWVPSFWSISQQASTSPTFTTLYRQ